MRRSLKEFIRRALARPEVRHEYDRLADEFILQDDRINASSKMASPKLGKEEARKLLEQTRIDFSGKPMTDREEANARR